MNRMGISLKKLGCQKMEKPEFVELEKDSQKVVTR
jgi:hypothetical protein